MICFLNNHIGCFLCSTWLYELHSVVSVFHRTGSHWSQADETGFICIFSGCRFWNVLRAIAELLVFYQYMCGAAVGQVICLCWGISLFKGLVDSFSFLPLSPFSLCWELKGGLPYISVYIECVHIIYTLSIVSTVCGWKCGTWCGMT